MLEDKDIQVIEAVLSKTVSQQKQEIDNRLEQQKQEINDKLEQQKQEILSETTQSMNILLETKVQYQLNLLAEGQQAILDKLVPRSRIDELEEEVKLLKVVVRKMDAEIQQLQQA